MQPKSNYHLLLQLLLALLQLLHAFTFAMGYLGGIYFIANWTSEDIAAEAQGFVWLDDLAAVGDGPARKRAQDWVWDWIARYGTGRGPGWSPDLTGRRLIRWINHALFLLSGRDKAQSEAYFAQVTAQTVFLSGRWKQAAPGRPRFEALAGLVVAGLALTGMEKLVAPAVAALAAECAREVDRRGGIPTRNPEELLDVFTLLTWAEQALSEAGRMPPPALVQALERIAPTLRAPVSATSTMSPPP